MINCNNLFWAPTDKRKEEKKECSRRGQSPAGIREVSRGH